MRESQFESLLAAAYRCPGNASAWTRLARDIAQAYAAEHVHLVLFRPDGTVAADTASDREAGREYVVDYASRDLAPSRVLANAPGQAPWSHTLLSAAELARCPVQNELLPRVGVGSRTWVYTPFGQDLIFSSTILHRRTGGGLDARASRRLERLHGHLQQAMHLHLTLEAAYEERRSMEAGLDALGTGVILLSRTEGVLFANRTARDFFDRGLLRIAAARLGAPSAMADAALRRLVGAALGYSGPPLGGTADLPGFRLRAIPITEPANGLDMGAAAVVLIHDTAAPILDPTPLLALGLTPAEAELATALASGEALNEYSARTGRARGTVRAQLRAVFGKTDTHRQSELVLYVLRASGLG